LLRDGSELTVAVELDKQQTQQIAADTLHPALRGAELRSDDRQGIRVTAVESGSPADRIGLRENDVVIAVNRQLVNNARELQQAISETSGVVALNLRRGNSQLYLVLPN
jgi:serine protease Do/serine protease DegQ